MPNNRIVPPGLTPLKYATGLCNILGLSPSVSEVGVVMHDVLFDRVVRFREIRTEKRVPPRLHERVSYQNKGQNIL